MRIVDALGLQLGVFVLAAAFCVPVGFGQLTPLTPNDPYYSDNPTFPGGQYWLRVTRTNYAWSIAGYTLGQQAVSTRPGHWTAVR